MPEVRVQLSDEQVEWLRKLDPGDYFNGSPRLLLINAVREQLPPPIKVGDRVRYATFEDGRRTCTVLAADGGYVWLGTDGANRVYATAIASELVRVEEGE